VAFLGKLGGRTKRQATALVRRQGGVPVERPGDAATLLVIGDGQLLLNEDELFNESTRQAIDEGRLKVLSETELWEQLGLVGEEDATRKL
jgi:hypothetical protein